MAIPFPSVSHASLSDDEHGPAAPAEHGVKDAAWDSGAAAAGSGAAAAYRSLPLPPCSRQTISRVATFGRAA